MDLAVTWKLVRLQVRLHRLEGYQKTLTDLSDIRELRTFRDDVLEALRDAAARGLTPPDPAAVVAADWERLRKWSNHLQNALRRADNTAADLDAPAGHFEISQLTSWVSELEAAPNHLSAALTQARNTIRPAEWQEGQPHLIFALVAQELGWNTNLVLVDPVGKWAQDIPKLLHPLCASYRIAKVNDSPVRARLDMLAQRLSKAQRLVKKHAKQAAELEQKRAKHAAELDELARLILAGSGFIELESRLLLIAPETRFPDFNYADIDAFIRREAKRKSQLQNAVEALRQMSSAAETCCHNLVELKLKLREISILSAPRSDDLITLCHGCDVLARAQLSTINTDAPRLLEQLGALVPATFYPESSASQFAVENELFQSLSAAINEQADALAAAINEQVAALATAIDELAQLKRQLKRQRTKRISIIVALAILTFGLVGFGIHLSSKAKIKAAAEKRLEWTGKAMLRAGFQQAVVTKALTKGGTVVVWGGNDRGQARVPDKLTGVVAIAAGDRHTVALKSDGTVVAWGLNYEGQTTVPSGLTGVVAIAAGHSHTVALKSDGTVVAWGQNRRGESRVPDGLTGVVAIAAGDFHSVALKSDGTVVVWGRNTNEDQTYVPAGLTDVVAIAAVYSHTVALKSDGTVVAWGRNTNEDQTYVPAGLTDVVAIAAGGFDAMALKSDGTVVAWRYNGSGQASVSAGLTDVVAIAAGYFHTVALKSDGTVVAWGDNPRGQTTVPAGLTGVVSIAAGNEHTVALKLE